MSRVAGALAVLLLLSLPVLAQSSVPSAGALPEPLVGPATAVVNGSAFLLGGRVGNAGTAAIVRYDPLNQSAYRVGTLPSSPTSSPDGAREAAAAFALNGKVYLAGGAARIGATAAPADVRTLVDIVEFDPATNATRVTSDALPVGRFSAGVAVLGTKAYLLGGASTAGGVASYLDDIIVYDGAAPEGSRVSVHAASLPAGIRDARAVAIDGAILLIGGLHEAGAGDWACPEGIVLCQTRNVARFDPASGTTSVVARLWTSMTSAEAERIGGAVHVIGASGPGIGNAMNATRIALDTWAVSNGTRIENATSAGGVAVLGGAIYRFGGKLASNSLPRTDVRIFYGDGVPPGAPLALSAQPEGNGTRLTWLEPLPPLASSRVFVVDRVVNGTTTRIQEGPELTFLDNASAGTSVTYRVAATNASAEGPAALVDTVAGAQPAAPPTAPRAYAAGGKVLVAWDAPANATEFVVEREGIRVARVSARSFTDTVVGRAYAVRETKGGVDGVPAVTVPEPLLAPTGVNVTLAPNAERSAYIARLAWNGSAGHEYEVLSGASQPTLGDPQRTTHATHEARIVPGTASVFAVRRVVAGLEGPISAPVIARAPSLPPAPGWLEANATATSIELAWEHVAPGNATYTLWRSGADGVERALATALRNATFVDDTALENVLYTYFVTTEAELRSTQSPHRTAAITPALASPTPTSMPTPTPSSPPTPATPTPVATPPPSSPVVVPSPTPTTPPRLSAPGEGEGETPGLGLLVSVAVMVAVAVALRRRP